MAEDIDARLAAGMRKIERLQRQAKVRRFIWPFLSIFGRPRVVWFQGGMVPMAMNGPAKIVVCPGCGTGLHEEHAIVPNHCPQCGHTWKRVVPYCQECGDAVFDGHRCTRFIGSTSRAVN